MLCALVLLACGIGISYLITSSSPASVDKDVTQYWASARLLVHGSNPYDVDSVGQLEKQAGAPIEHGGQVMFNLPCALFFVLPLGALSARSAIFLWSLAVVASLVLSVRLLWIMNGRRDDRLHLLAYVFAPVLASVVLGQIVPVALLGVLLFIRWHDSRPLLAGVAVALLELKPHLFFPFAAVLLVWAIEERRIGIMAGAALGCVATFAVPFCFDHRLLAEYWPVMRSASAMSHAMPNLSSTVHALFPKFAFVQYLPAALGCVAAVVWYLRRRGNWRWSEEGLLLLAVSVLVAPYSWFEDEVLMLPAVLRSLYLRTDAGRSIALFGLLDAAALALVFCNVHLDTGAYIWTGVAWIVWIVYSRRAERIPVTVPA